MSTVFEAFNTLRMELSLDRFEHIVTLADLAPTVVADFIDGGNEGWADGDDAHQDWLNEAPDEEIADWILHGQ